MHFVQFILLSCKTLTDATAEHNARNAEREEGVAEREETRGDTGQHQRAVVEKERVNPGQIAHESARHSRHGVGDSDLRDEQGALLLRQTHLIGVRWQVSEWNEEAWKYFKFMSNLVKL